MQEVLRDGHTVPAVGGSCRRCAEALSLETGSLLSGKQHEARNQETQAPLSHVTPLLPDLVSHSLSLNLSFPIYKENIRTAIGATGGRTRGLLSQDLTGRWASRTRTTWGWVGSREHISEAMPPPEVVRKGSWEKAELKRATSCMVAETEREEERAGKGVSLTS